MRKFMAVGTLMGVLAMIMGLGAISASAAEWLCGGVAANKCKVVSENLETFVLEDMGVPAAVECEPGAVTDVGTVGPGVNDETTKVDFKLANCHPAATAELLNGEKDPNGCEKLKNIEAENLPWKTEGVSEKEGTEKWDLILSSTTGLPGTLPAYLIECETKLGLVDDLCETVSNARSVLIELKNLPAEGAEPALVTGLFLLNPLNANEAAKCTVGGEEEGLVFGEILFAALNAKEELQSLEFDTP